MKLFVCIEEKKKKKAMQLNVTVKIVIKLFRRYTRHWNLFIIQFNDFLSLCTYCKQTVLVADRRSSTDIGSVQRLTQAQPSAINVLLPCAVTRYSKKPQKRNDRKLECQQLWDLNAYHLFWLDPFFFFYSLFFFELLKRILFSIHTDESTIKSTRAFFCCAVTCDLLLLSGRSHSMKISRVNNSAYVCLVRMSGLGFF